MSELPWFEKVGEEDEFRLTAQGREKAKQSLERACKAEQLSDFDQVLLAHVLKLWQEFTDMALEEGYT